MKKLHSLLSLLLTAVLLTGMTGQAAAEMGQMMHYKNAEDYVFAVFGPESGVSWDFWPWQFDCDSGEGEVAISGAMNDEMQITEVNVEASALEDEGERMDALNRILSALFDAVQYELPFPFEAIANDPGPSMGEEGWVVYPLEGMYFSVWNTDGSPLFDSEEDLRRVLAACGVQMGEISRSRTAVIGDDYVQMQIIINENSQVTSAVVTCYGDNADMIEGVLTQAASNLLYGAPLEQAMALVSEQSQLEIGKSKQVKEGDYRIRLRKTESGTALTIRALKLPEDAVSFFGDINAEQFFAARQAEEEARRQAEQEAAEKERQARQAAVEEALAQIDATAQIEPTLLYEGEGLRITAEALAYGSYRSGEAAIGLVMRAEKDEGVMLERVSAAADAINRWYSRYNRFNGSEGGKFSELSNQSGQVTVEDTLWWSLDTLKEEIPGFAGISSLDVHVNIRPAGEDWIHSDSTRLVSTLAEAPVPGKLLYDQDGIRLILTDMISEMDERGRIGLGLVCENNTDASMPIGVNYETTKVNGLYAYSAVDLWAEAPADGRTLLDLKVRMDDIDVDSPAQIESLDFDLIDYEATKSLYSWEIPALAKVSLTAVDLGVSPEEAALAQANPYADELPETVLYDLDGLKLTLLGLSRDGQGLDILFENNSDAWGEAYIREIYVNGWEEDAYHSAYSFPAQGGERFRRQINLGEGVPDFGGYASVRFTVKLYRDDPEWGETQEYEHIYIQPIEEEGKTISLVPAHPAEVTYDESGAVLFSEGGVRLIYRGSQVTDYDLELTLLIVNDTDNNIRFSEQDEPLIGYSPVTFSINGKTAQSHSFLSDSHAAAHTRKFSSFNLYKGTLEEMGFTAEEVETLDVTMALFPVNEKSDYTIFPVHIDVK